MEEYLSLSKMTAACLPEPFQVSLETQHQTYQKVPKIINK